MVRTMLKPYVAKMRGGPLKRGRPHVADALWSWLGAFLGMALIGWLSSHYLAVSSLLLVGSFGATSVLLYGAPHSPLAQPRNVLGGNMLSALVGVACYHWLGDGWLAAAMAVSVALLVMQLTHTLHPPGGATALIAVIGGQPLQELGYWYALLPVGLGCLAMLVLAVLINNLARHRRYPLHWH